MLKQTNIIKQTLSIALILMMLLQSSKHAVIYTWYHFNKDEITTKHCVNINKPELLCSGKCYMRTVVEADNSRQQSSTTPLASMLNYLNTEFLVTAELFGYLNSIFNMAFENLDSYTINYSFLLTHYIFHPPD